MNNELSSVPVPSVTHREVMGFPLADKWRWCQTPGYSSMYSPSAPVSACWEPQVLHSSRNLSDTELNLGGLTAGAPAPPGGPQSSPHPLGHLPPCLRAPG